ncbi:MAG: prephenate dehydratase [Actinobacteria bacterium]|nr:MAG: prephenate dehydratase [Candidatus Atribacteria bacterium]TET14692.1 MAG: prephenate dehydratase [Actinomycetota bacterium]
MSIKKKIAYLGPPGTFTEEALDKFVKDISQVRKISFPTVADVIRSVDRGEADEGLVPMENSIEGSVNITQDILTFESEAKIIGEVIIPVKHSLIGKKKIKLDNIKKVISHPHATAQCRKYLSTNLKGAEVIAANSTAEAVKILKKENDDIAAIGTKTAAKIYDLKIIENDIEDNKDNKTRFVFIGNSIQPKTGNDKTSIVCFLKEDRPGSLYNILKEFACRNINLTRLESRPAKKDLGDYVFMIDLEGHLHDENIFEAIEVLRKSVYLVKILGSYPKWIESNRR